MLTHRPKSGLRKSLRLRRPQKKSFENSEEFSSIDVVREHLSNNFTTAAKGHYLERCNFLNALKQLVWSTDQKALNNPDFFNELCKSITFLLKDDHPSIRAMCFCILTKTFFTERNLVVLLKSHVDIYVLRAIDICADNERERSEAFKLVKKMVSIFEGSNLKDLYTVSASNRDKKSFAFPMSIMQPIISIALYAINIPTSATTAEFERDRLAAPSIGLFFEFCLVEPMLVYRMAGTEWMVKILKGESDISKNLSHVVTHILIHWLDSPELRKEAALHSVLEQILAPMVELGLFYRRAEDQQERVPQRLNDFLSTFRISFLRLLRSWPGIFACAAVGPNFEMLPTSPLRLLEHLGLGTVDNEILQTIREMVIDLCCDLIETPYADKKFDSWTQALEFYENMRWTDSFKSSLKNDFVLEQFHIEEARSVKNSTDIDLMACYRSFAIFVLVNASLPQSLARLILANPDCPSSIKATMLMSDLLKLSPAIVPSGWRASVVSVPSLFHAACEAVTKCTAAAAINGNVEELIAGESVNNYTFVHSENAQLALHRLDELNSAWMRSTSSSNIPSTSNLTIFTSHAPQPSYQSGCTTRTDGNFTQEAFDTYDKRKFLLEDMVNCIDDFDYSAVVVDDDAAQNLSVDLMNCVVADELDWDQLSITVKTLEKTEVSKQASSILLLDVCTKLITIISPSEAESFFFTPAKASTSKLFVEIVLKIAQFEGQHSHGFKLILEDYARKCCKSMKKKNSAKSPFFVRNVDYTTAMYHYAVLGAFTSFERGLSILAEAGVLHLYLETIDSDAPEEHVKLIVSSLDYALDGLPRIILEAALTRSNDASRRWVTRFMATLATRTEINFEKWGIKLLLGQLADQDGKVVRHAFRLLFNIIPKYPNNIHLIYKDTHLDTFSDAGVILKANFFANESFLQANAEEARQSVEFWMKKFNIRYMRMIEEELTASLIGVRRSLDGHFSRDSDERPTYTEVLPPKHLFAVLTNTSQGRKILVDTKVIPKLVKSLKRKVNEVQEVKAALLALASIGSQDEGFEILPAEVIPKMLRLAEGSPTLTVRGVAFCALNMMAKSEKAARALTSYGWESSLHRNIITEVKKESGELVGRRTTTARTRTRGSSVPEIDTILGRPKSNSVSGHFEAPKNLENRRKSTEERRGRARTLTKPLRLTRTSSDVVLNAISESRLVSSSDEDNENIFVRRTDGVRSRRSHTVLTLDSMSTSSLVGSMTRDATISPSTVSFSRLRSHTLASTVDSTLQTRSTVVSKCLNDGLSVTKAQLELEAVKADTIRDSHFSSSLRLAHHLAPLYTRKFLQVRRNVADNLQYIFMTKDEERHFSEYRRIVMKDSWLWCEFRKEDAETQRSVNIVAARPVVLPAELVVMCQNIFTVRSFQGEGSMDSETEAKSTETTSPQKMLIKQPHTAYRCFYCANEAKDCLWKMPPGVDSAQAASLRAEVLAQVDMLEIKETLPERRLLKLRESYRWVFEWPCLYADVLELLDEFRFKPSSRSFLQQIFYGALLL